MPNKSYPAELVWAASCAAQRVNGSYIKYSGSNNEKLTNRQLVESYLEKELSQINEVDYKTASEMKRYFQGMIFQIIADQYLSAFETAAIKIAAENTIQYSDIALVCAIPYIYEKKLKEDKVNERIQNATGGTYLKDENISVNIEVLKSIYSKKWSKYYNTGITSEDKIVFFSTYIALNQYHKYDISGKVIDIINQNTSKLKYVKVQKYEN